MKKLFLLLFVIASLNLDAQYLTSFAKDVNTKDVDGFYYHLPRNVIRLDLVIEKQQFIKGKYAVYAKEMLNTDNYVFISDLLKDEPISRQLKGFLILLKCKCLSGTNTTLYSQNKLAKELGIGKSTISNYMKEAEEKGYITTMFGRRRPVPELSSSNFMQRSFGERVAMNSPIQGTAADIIKIAMIKVAKRLKKEGLESKLILQVHDELLIETKEEEKDKVAAILEEEMKGAAKLAVSLEVDLHTGSNWYEAK